MDKPRLTRALVCLCLIWLAMLAVLWLIGCGGCLAHKPVCMIPNFAVVDSAKHIYRGGQPTTVQQWDYLASLGVRNDIKLDNDSEGMDEEELRVSDRFDEDNLFIGLIEQMFGVPGEYLDQIVGDIRPNTFIHCEHGQDRTGLVVACYRVRVQHWTKAAAEKEMLAHGFHKSLVGLWRTWEDFKP